jgi:nitrile hydratase accessory protein
VKEAPPDASVFAEPWEAQVFALAVALHERGLFTWPEWSAALGHQVSEAGDDPDPRDWLAALELLLDEKGVADAPTIARYADAWGRAARRTPHGTPIELRPEDLAGR